MSKKTEKAKMAEKDKALVNAKSVEKSKTETKPKIMKSLKKVGEFRSADRHLSALKLELWRIEKDFSLPDLEEFCDRSLCVEPHKNVRMPVFYLEAIERQPNHMFILLGVDKKGRRYFIFDSEDSDSEKKPILMFNARVVDIEDAGFEHFAKGARRVFYQNGGRPARLLNYTKGLVGELI